MDEDRSDDGVQGAVPGAGPGHEPDSSATPAPVPPAPLTRRELRALRQAGSGSAESEPAPQPDDPSETDDVPTPDDVQEPADRPSETERPPDGETAPTEQPPDGETAPTEQSSSAETTDDAWHQAVDWSLHHELPRELPPEPDVDDVRWDGDEPPAVARIPVLPARRPAMPRPGTGPATPLPSAPGGSTPRTWPGPPLARSQGLGGGPATPPGPFSPTSHTPPQPPAPTRPASDEPAGTQPQPAGAHGANGLSPARGEQGSAEETQTLPKVAGVATGHGPQDPSPDGEAGPGDDHPAQPHHPEQRTTATGSQPAAVTSPPPAAVDGPSADASGAASLDAEWTATRPDTLPDEAEAELPTLTDLLAARPKPPEGPAERGWQAVVRRMTGGRISPGPGPAEREHRAAAAQVQRSLNGPKTIVVINPKGGAHKTTAALLIAATFGRHRGGYTLAWDNNETRGTLGWRSRQSNHHNTAVDLLQDLDRFVDPKRARVGDLDNYVRTQGPARFDVLASDEDAASAASIDDFAFRSLHRTLSRFYRVIVVDTGNNMRASNWQAAIEAADQVVIVSTIREDTAQSAAWAIDALRATGHEDAVRKAVTVLSAPSTRRDEALARRLHEHFGQLTRAVLDVPYDPALVAGGPLDYDVLAEPTREAWLRVSAAIAEGL